jgi:beta-glucosidase/6-phospho-beta-glucosidase/beta-galactosidase
LKNGRRLDLVSSTGHDRFAEADFARLREFGMLTVREGLRWHLIEPRPGHYDFSSALTILEAAQKEGIQIIWDLFHFGWPDGLDIFSPGWVTSFGNFAAAFAAVLRKETSDTAFIAPANEISFVSWAGGDTAYLNPFSKGRGGELKRQLIRGAIQASEAVLAELPGARLVSPEPVIHIVGDPQRPDDMRQAAEYRSAMFEAWDMLSGRAQPELGGQERYLDVIGINYYDRNQWWNFGGTIYRNEPEYRPFREILLEVWERYGRPLFLSETGTENEDRPAWLAYVASEVRGAIDAGAPLHGICLYPILNHPGWDDDRHCHNALWDYPGPSGEREIYQPLADQLKLLQSPENTSYDSKRSDLSVPPTVEFRVSAAATPDEPLRR